MTSTPVCTMAPAVSLAMSCMAYLNSLVPERTNRAMIVSAIVIARNVNIKSDVLSNVTPMVGNHSLSRLFVKICIHVTWVCVFNIRISPAFVIFFYRVYNFRRPCHAVMLVFGTCNPAGEVSSHNGVYLRKEDISSLVRDGSLLNLPVKIEHVGTSVGKVVSAWEHGDRLDCVFRIDGDSIDSIFAQEFVKSRRCPELSLSYSVTMQHSADGSLTGGGKDMIEISIVRSGARNDCLIRGFAS